MVELTVTKLRGFIDKSIGLLNKDKAFLLLLKTRFGIHTFAMKFPIDVLVIDKDDRVVKLVKNLKPNKIFVWPLRFDTVIELPAGEIEKKKIKIGEKVKIIIKDSG
jgi:uncharacterized protein